MYKFYFDVKYQLFIMFDANNIYLDILRGFRCVVSSTIISINPKTMKIQVRSTTLSIACAEKMIIFYNASTLKLETAVGSPFDDEQYIYS